MATKTKYNKLYLPYKNKSTNLGSNFNNSLINLLRKQMIQADQHSQKEIDNYKNLYNNSQNQNKQFTSRIKESIDKFKERYTTVENLNKQYINELDNYSSRTRTDLIQTCSHR